MPVENDNQCLLWAQTHVYNKASTVYSAHNNVSLVRHVTSPCFLNVKLLCGHLERLKTQSPCVFM